MLSGVLLYTASSRQRLQQPAEEVEEASDEELDEAQVAGKVSKSVLVRRASSP